MPTLRGKLIGGIAAVFVAAGWYYGRVELYALGVASASAFVGAVLYVHLGRSRLTGERHITPARAHHGARCTVELTLVNHSRRTTPCVAVDAFRDPERARVKWNGPAPADSTTLLDVPVLKRNGTVRASYHPPTDRRGRFVVGPLTLRREDPFGLVQHDRTLLRAGELIVYPQIHSVAAMPSVPAQDLQSKLVRSAASLDGEEFFALRPYQMGDDLRRAHWPTTARMDELMIRQLEPPREERITVVLDVDARTNTTLSLDFTTSVAASVLTASHRASKFTRIVMTDGRDSGFERSAAHWESTLEMLAGATPASRTSLAETLRRLGRLGTTGSVAVVATAVTPTDLQAITWLGTRVGEVVLVLVERSAYAAPQAVRSLPPTAIPRHVRVARISDATSFPVEWAAAVLRPRASTPTRAGSALR